MLAVRPTTWTGLKNSPHKDSRFEADLGTNRSRAAIIGKDKTAMREKQAPEGNAFLKAPKSLKDLWHSVRLNKEIVTHRFDAGDRVPNILEVGQGGKQLKPIHGAKQEKGWRELCLPLWHHGQPT